MKKTLINGCLLVCLFLGNGMIQNILAQQKKVKEIIGWGKYNKSQKKSQKFFARAYNKQGKMLRKQDFRLYVDNTYTYNDEGKLAKIDGYEGETSFTVTFVHGKKVTTQIMKTPDDQVSKTHVYRNSRGYKIEEKMYEAGKLHKRIVYTRNKQDSVIGEMHYLYSGKKRKNYKVIYTYDRETHLKTHKNEYDAGGRVIEQEDYTYNAQGELLKITKIFPQRKNNDYNTTIEYKYQQGNIWQIINKSNNGMYESRKIFKDGILVRIRKYEKGQLTELVDYQYIYY